MERNENGAKVVNPLSEEEVDFKAPHLSTRLTVDVLTRRKELLFVAGEDLGAKLVNRVESHLDECAHCLNLANENIKSY